MFRVELFIELTLVGPILSQSTAMGAYGIDAVMTRTPDGRPYLADTLIRGKLRDALEQLLQVHQGTSHPQIVGWFGPAVEKDPLEWGDLDSTPMMGRLAVSDFVCPEQFPSHTLTRIRIDENTGAVEEGSLLVIDSPARPGESIKFRGTIEAVLKDASGLHEFLKWMNIGLRWISSYGSERTVGFGQAESVKLLSYRILDWSSACAVDRLRGDIDGFLKTLGWEPAEPAGISIGLASSLTTTKDPGQGRYTLRVELLDPFCVAKRRENLNLFESLDWLSGAVLKGSVAALLMQLLNRKPGVDVRECSTDSRWGALCEHFTEIRFCSAFPVRKQSQNRPVVRPQSLVIGEKESGPRTLTGASYKGLRDAAWVEDVFLLGKTTRTAPKFQIDWKDGDKPEDQPPPRLLGGVAPGRELRVHTSIDAEKLRARTNFLFAQERVRPEGVDWLGAIDLHRISDGGVRALVWKQLNELFQYARFRIGKTKARATFRIEGPSTTLSDLTSAMQPKENKWVVVLQSPALLCDPERVAQGTHSDTGGDPLEKAYRDAWQKLSGASLNLVRFFARQSLHGGYLAYRVKERQKKPYNPILTTDEGSVFVLEPAAPELRDKALQCIKGWYEEGLPTPAWATQLLGDSFKTNPFLPAAGFGEIAVNLPLHENLKPDDGELLVLR